MLKRKIHLIGLCQYALIVMFLAGLCYSRSLHREGTRQAATSDVNKNVLGNHYWMSDDEDYARQGKQCVAFLKYRLAAKHTKTAVNMHTQIKMTYKIVAVAFLFDATTTETV